MLSVVLTVELMAVSQCGVAGCGLCRSEVAACCLTQAGAGTGALNDGVFAGVVED